MMTGAEGRRRWVEAASAVVLASLDELAERLTTEIRDTLPDYASVPFDGLRQAVHGQVGLAINAISAGVALTPEVLAAAEAAGRAGAERGGDLSELLQTYVLANRQLLQSYVKATGVGQPTADEIFEIASTMLTVTQDFASAAASGFQIVAASRFADDVRAERRFLDLVSTEPTSLECSTLAGELGFDLGGSFQALAFRSDGDINRLRSGLRSATEAVVGAPHGSLSVVLWQGARPAVVQRLVRPLAEGHVVGLGRRRSELNGANLSVGEAVHASRLASRRGADVDFADQWLLASVLAMEPHLDHLETGVRMASLHPHLAATVRAFAESGFSAAQAGRAQHLHANSVAYRLERWEQLTGWNVHDFEGLARSVVAVQLAAPGLDDDAGQR